jgi:hypothetical protein
MGGGAIIAAVAAARQRGLERVIDGYRLGEATSFERAKPLSELGLVPNNWVDELREAGVLKPGGGPDSWYLDESANLARRDARFRRNARKRIAMVLLALLILGGIALAVAMGDKVFL